MKCHPLAGVAATRRRRDGEAATVSAIHPEVDRASAQRVHMRWTRLEIPPLHAMPEWSELVLQEAARLA